MLSCIPVGMKKILTPNPLTVVVHVSPVYHVVISVSPSSLNNYIISITMIGARWSSEAINSIATC